MRCIPNGRLRAHLDDALSPQDRQAVTAHLADCPRCQARLDALSANAALAETRLEQLAPPDAADPRRALLMVQSRIHAEPRGTISHWRDMFMRTKVWRSVAIGVTALALVVGGLSFGPTRAAARQLLSVFRVRRFAIVQINPSQDQAEAISQAMEELLGDQEPQVIVDEPVQAVATIDEASALAGFGVRMPGYLPGEGATRIEVKGRTEIAMQVKRESLTLLFEMAGMDPSLVPADFSEGEVLAMAPAAVAIMRDRLTVVQMRDPSVEYPAGLDPQPIGKAGLILLGFSPEDAERITRGIDWSTTLLLPVPTDMVSVQETEVAGNQALLLRPADGQSDAVLMWQDDDIMCLVSGKASSDTLMQAATSMYP